MKRATIFLFLMLSSMAMAHGALSAGAHGALGADVSKDEKPAPLKAEAELDLEGVYWVEGTEKGKPYDGTVRLRRHGSVYVVIWSVAGGGSDAVGIGTIDGGKLLIGWHIVGRTCGQHIMTISGAGKALEGRWYGLPGNGEAQTEKWTLLKGK